MNLIHYHWEKNSEIHYFEILKFWWNSLFWDFSRRNSLFWDFEISLLTIDFGKVKGEPHFLLTPITRLSFPPHFLPVTWAPVLVFPARELRKLRFLLNIIETCASSKSAVVSVYFALLPALEHIPFRYKNFGCWIKRPQRCQSNTFTG